MTAPNLPQPPMNYDFRDQIELRRLIMLNLQAQSNALQQVTLSGGAPSGTLEITGGSATSTYEATDTLDGGTA